MSEPTATNPSPTLTPSPSPTPDPTPTPSPSPTPTPEPKKDETKVTAPLTIEALKLPEGVELDKPSAEKLLNLLNDDKLDPTGRANGLFTLHTELMKAAHEKGLADWQTMQDGWIEAAKADPIIGGDKLEPALGAIAKLIDKYSVDKDGKPDPKLAQEFRELMDTSGAGNNRSVIRILHGMAKDLAIEGTPVPASIPANASRSTAQIMFPNHPSNS